MKLGKNVFWVRFFWFFSFVVFCTNIKTSLERLQNNKVMFNFSLRKQKLKM